VQNKFFKAGFQDNRNHPVETACSKTPAMAASKTIFAVMPSPARLPGRIIRIQIDPAGAATGRT